MLIVPTKSQETDAEQVLGRLYAHRLAYLAGEERTGKTLTAILAAEDCPAKHVVVLTKAKALPGWLDTFDKYPVKKRYTVTTYGKVDKVAAPSNFLLVLDESHNYLSAFPKPGSTWKKVQVLGKLASAVLHISATPHAQGHQQLFHQFAVHRFSPWRSFANFYNWFRVYGEPYTIEIQDNDVPQYDRVKTELIVADVQHLFVTRTREELGFIEPEDSVHYIELGEDTKYVYNKLMTDRLVQLKAGLLVCDTVAKLRAALHMLEGGVAKINEDYIVLANREKIDWIKENFGDTASMVIMYNYKAEKTKLEAEFKNARLLQATSYSEGVDLHEYEHLIIYSQDWSTARHSQRRARQANLKRKTPIVVHFLLVKKAISEQCYKTVALNKKNFVDSVFQLEKL